MASALEKKMFQENLEGSRHTKDRESRTTRGGLWAHSRQGNQRRAHNRHGIPRRALSTQQAGHAEEGNLRRALGTQSNLRAHSRQGYLWKAMGTQQSNPRQALGTWQKEQTGHSKDSGHTAKRAFRDRLWARSRAI